MRKILILIVTVLAVWSCNFLDFDETNGVYEHDDMYKYFNKLTQMVTNVYRYLPQDLGAINGAMRDCGCDDAEYGDPNNPVQYFNNGNWSALATVDSSWELYRAIRAANEYLMSHDDIDLSMYKDNTQYTAWMEKLSYYPYEVRVLRAHYFFELARRYGDIAMPLKKLSIEEAGQIGKTPFNDVIAFIVKECDECAPNLPNSFLNVTGREYGRMTRGYAMALKSKALLYAASKLHNPEMDKDKWKASAKAALDIIDLNIYQLEPGEKANSTESYEIVMARLNSFSNSFELNNFPLRFVEGKRSGITGTYPSQNLVDAFQTKNGYDIVLTATGWKTEDPRFDITRPYHDRDPRFERAILANGMKFKGLQIAVYKGGADYAPTRDQGSPTGYYIRRYITESTSFTPNAMVTNKHSWIMYRYAETLLTYAESMVEAFDSPAYKDGTYRISAQEALNMVRNSANMPDVKTTDKQEFIEALRREWRVEFAFEDHRFWDVRRWCIGAETQTSLDGVSISKNEDNALIYKRIRCENRTWNNRMNLYPIPQTELYNNEHLYPQNPNW